MKPLCGFLTADGKMGFKKTKTFCAVYRTQQWRKSNTGYTFWTKTNFFKHWHSISIISVFFHRMLQLTTLLWENNRRISTHTVLNHIKHFVLLHFKFLAYVHPVNCPYPRLLTVYNDLNTCKSHFSSNEGPTKQNPWHSGLLLKIFRTSSTHWGKKKKCKSGKCGSYSSSFRHAPSE